MTIRLDTSSRDLTFLGPFRASIQYRQFVDAADKQGLPTAFLRRILSSTYGVVTDGIFGDSTNVTLNTIFFKRKVLDGVANFGLHLPLDSMQHVDTIYHESVHAYFDLLENDPRFRGIIARGIEYYRNAPTVNGLKARHPERLFQEAVADYVADRVGETWKAALELAQQDNRPNAAQHTQTIKNLYNEAMARRVFGYSNESGFFAEDHTQRPISAELKAFLDREILETKIPDNFDDNRILKSTINNRRLRQPRQGPQLRPLRSRPNLADARRIIPEGAPFAISQIRAHSAQRTRENAARQRNAHTARKARQDAAHQTNHLHSAGQWWAGGAASIQQVRHLAHVHRQTSQKHHLQGHHRHPGKHTAQTVGLGPAPGSPMYQPWKHQHKNRHRRHHSGVHLASGFRLTLPPGAWNQAHKQAHKRHHLKRHSHKHGRHSFSTIVVPRG